MNKRMYTKQLIINVITILIFISFPFILVFGAVHEIEVKEKPEKPKKFEYDINTYKGNKDTIFVVTKDEFNKTIRYYAVDEYITRINPFKYEKNKEINISNCYDTYNDYTDDGYKIKSYDKASCKIYDESGNEVEDKTAKKIVKKFIKTITGARIMDYKVIKLDNEYYIIIKTVSGDTNYYSIIEYKKNKLYRILYKADEEIIAIKKKDSYTCTPYNK